VEAQTEPGPAPRLDARGRITLVRAGVRRALVQDLYLRLLAAPWPLLLAALGVSYLGANAVFAAAYLLGGDALTGARPGSFGDAFFFSVHTMATIGYGSIAPHTLYAHILVTIESMVGLLGLALVTGLMFAKFSRPTARVLFSHVAVVTRRDGVPSLMFRMANARGNQIVEARLHAVLALTEQTPEGEVLRRLYDLALVRSQHVLFTLSWTAVHQITPHSPLFHKSAADLAAAEAEIVVSLTGLDDAYAQTVYARHAYANDDIRWGARFVDILSHTPDGRRRIDYAHFHDAVSDQDTTAPP
jgi:inward rectifier potassium channel